MSRGSLLVQQKLQRYEKIDFLGEGQFATVYKARDKENDNIVAVKKIKMGSREEARDGIHRTALREIKILQEVHHPNIISLFDVFGLKSEVSLVFDFMDTDLEVIIKDVDHIVLTPNQIKAYMIMMLRGLEFLHSRWVLHRDIKPNNLLVNKEGVLKLGDFGLARFYGSPNRQLSHQVVTRWYRSPELLYGARQYGHGVDTWAIGCVLAEMLIRNPFFPGESDLHQLTLIFTALGTPNEETWPKMKELPDYVVFKVQEGNSMESMFPGAQDDLLQLLEGLLDVNPSTRLNCTQCLKLPYFFNDPKPAPGASLPLPAAVKKKLYGSPLNGNSESNGVRSLKRKMDPNSMGATMPKRLQF